VVRPYVVNTVPCDGVEAGSIIGLSAAPRPHFAGVTWAVGSALDIALSVRMVESGESCGDVGIGGGRGMLEHTL
jgi:hypothetical protein